MAGQLKQTKYSSIRDQELPPWGRYPETAEEFDALVAASDEIFAATFDLFSDGTLTVGDLILAPTAARALEAIEAFLAAMKQWNISTASVAVRLQVDNLLRANLLEIVSDPMPIFECISKDRPLRKLKLPDELLAMLPEQKRGQMKFYTDGALQELASQTYPWVPHVYRAASSYVHFSNSHIQSVFTAGPGNELNGRIPVDTGKFDAEFVSGLTGVMRAASTTLVGQLARAVAKKRMSKDDAAHHDVSSSG